MDSIITMSDSEMKATSETCSDILSRYKLESATYTGSYGTCGEWWRQDSSQGPGGGGGGGGGGCREVVPLGQPTCV